MINDQLGLDVIPKTRFAEHGSERGIVMDLVTGKAPGEAASQGMPLDDAAHRKISAEQSKLDRGATKPEDFKLNMKLLGFKADPGSDEWRLHPSNGSQINLKDPVLQNKLNDLEWLDIITGQLDRNSTNYLVTFDANGKPNGVKGIDNDFSLGAAHPNPDNVAKTNLPRMIDSQTAAAIEQMGRDWNQPGGMKERISELLSPNRWRTWKAACSASPTRRASRASSPTSTICGPTAWSCRTASGTRGRTRADARPTGWRPRAPRNGPA
jgi:hypothetical protein